MWFASSSPCSEQLFLCCETLSLIDRVIQLGVSICHLPAIHKELKTLYIVRIVRFLLCQRRNLDRMIHDKGRLDQMLLDKFLKEQVQDIALLMALLKLYMMLLCKLLLLPPVSESSLKSTPAYFLTASTMVMRCEWLAQIHLNTVVDNVGGSKNFLCHITVQILCQIHHAVIIGICLI